MGLDSTDAEDFGTLRFLLDAAIDHRQFRHDDQQQQHLIIVPIGTSSSFSSSKIVLESRAVIATINSTTVMMMIVTIITNHQHHHYQPHPSFPSMSPFLKPVPIVISRGARDCPQRPELNGLKAEVLDDSRRLSVLGV